MVKVKPPSFRLMFVTAAFSDSVVRAVAASTVTLETNAGAPWAFRNR